MEKRNHIPGINYRFNDPCLLQAALTHRSRSKSNNERLEFLGDGILNFVVASRLYELNPNNNEGDLSRLRSRVVRGETLSQLAVKLKLGDYLLLGEGELKSGGFRRNSILGDALEAVLGAIYIDGGFEACETVIRTICEPVIANLPDAEDLKDPKTKLQEQMQATARALPMYDLVREEGAEHAKKFTIRARLYDPDMEVEASGSSRRKAEQLAAAMMLSKLIDAKK
ncbi:MAG: ribonuclease-3 [Lysobacterales bacterium]|jgi:ribonuclease-3